MEGASGGPHSAWGVAEITKVEPGRRLIAGGADVEHIAAATADAAENGLDRASDDIGLAHTFWLLTQIPLAARQADFSSVLRALGLDGLSAQPTLIEIVAAFGRA